MQGRPGQIWPVAAACAAASGGAGTIAARSFAAAPAITPPGMRFSFPK
ncbi:MAG: hypothetical protein AABZ30_10070 [Myxococcota bacterium]